MQTSSSLKQITGEVINGLLQEAVNHKSFFINDIDPVITVHADTTVLIPVLRDVLLKAITHTGNHCIRLSALAYGNIISLCGKQTGPHQGTAIAICMDQLQPLAEKLGGRISVVSDNSNSITVSFSFYNGLRAA